MFNRTNCISLVVRIVFFAGVVTVSAPANAQFVDELTKNVYIPNTFSPDGDEQNPVFLPIFSDPDLVTDYRLVVYNRKGEIIFESLDLRQGWDGIQFGYMATPGTYNWTMNFRYSDEENGQFKSGHINVWR